MPNFSEIILTWYASCGRDLPWRRTTDPYAIWLSEIILQQTRIAQGTAYWERFMERFPDVESLAAASEDEVLRLWQGLGYYSRARNLHAAARQIVGLGAFPTTLEGIRSLKGVGDYTAAAIGSFAFALPAAVVDGNVYRVLARVYGIETPVGSTEAKKQFTALAQSLLPADRPGDFNQAMMDFGATQCTPQNPSCGTCPLSGECIAFRTGRTADLPVRKAGPSVRERRFTYIYFRCDGMTAIHRRGPGDIWQGLWEPFIFESDPYRKSKSSTEYARIFSASSVQASSEPRPIDLSVIANYFSVIPGDPSVILNEAKESPSLRLLATNVRHQLTHQTLFADLYLCETASRPSLPDEYIWIPETDLSDYALPRLVQILLEEVRGT